MGPQPRDPRDPRSWTRQDGPSPGASEGVQPCDTSISDSRLPGLRRYILLFKSQLVIICYSWPRTLLQRVKHETGVQAPVDSKAATLGALAFGSQKERLKNVLITQSLFSRFLFAPFFPDSGAPGSLRDDETVPEVSPALTAPTTCDRGAEAGGCGLAEGAEHGAGAAPRPHRRFTAQVLLSALGELSLMKNIC